MKSCLCHSVSRLVLAGLAVMTLAGSDWPRFRGPNGTGESNDKDVPVKWGADGVLWKWPIPGTGNSSPVIAKGRLFLQSAAADASNRQLHCLDAASGKLLWTRTAPGTKARTHVRNTLASCTPAADGEQVYIVFWDGAEIALYAYDYEGALHWKRDLGPFKSQHGPGHSPMLYDGLVILANDQDGSAVLLAFDAKTGKTAWEVKRKPYRASYSTPLIRTNENGKPELVVASTGGVTGYEPRSGSENWNFNWTFAQKPLRTVGSPIVANGMVVALSGDGSGARHAVAFKLGGKGDVSSALAWEERKAFPYVPCPLVLGDHLYTVNDQGIASCHVLKTGEKVWSERLGSPVTASPLLVDGKIYAIGEDGQVYVYEAAPKFKLLGKSGIDENVMASPAVADSRLYIRGKTHLFCIGKGK